MAKRIVVPKLPSPKKANNSLTSKKEKQCSMCVPELESNLECVSAMTISETFPKTTKSKSRVLGTGNLQTRIL